MNEIDAYLERLASSAPTPGGGSAGALVGALGAALVAMVARIAAEGERKAAAERLAAEADRLRAAWRAAGDRDEAAFGEVVAAQRLPRATEDEKRVRTAAIQRALAAAAQEPLESARLALDGLRLCETALGLQHRGLASDVGCAAEFSLAGLRACAYNVRVNHAYLKDTELIARQRAALESIEQDAAASIERIRAGVSALLA